MSRRIARSYKSAMIQVFERYQNEVIGDDGEGLSLDDIAAWAVRKGYWKAQPNTEMRLCRRDLARALREERITDEKGRKIRRFHSVKITEIREDGSEKQCSLWRDGLTAAPEFMQQSFQQRRRGILGDCLQLKNDVDSHNDMHPDRTVQIVFNFEEDLMEMQQPHEYEPGPDLDA